MTNKVKVFYGVSTGDTGEYGVGDIFSGSEVTEDEDGCILLDGEPVLNVFKIVDGEVVTDLAI